MSMKTHPLDQPFPKPQTKKHSRKQGNKPQKKHSRRTRGIVRGYILKACLRNACWFCRWSARSSLTLALGRVVYFSVLFWLCCCLVFSRLVYFSRNRNALAQQKDSTCTYRKSVCTGRGRWFSLGFSLKAAKNGGPSKKDAPPICVPFWVESQPRPKQTNPELTVLSGMIQSS